MSARRFWGWLTLYLVLAGLLIFWFVNNCLIAIDPQAETCIDARILLINLNDRTPQKGELYAFYSPDTASPVYHPGTRMIKRAVGAPGDVVVIAPDLTISVNGKAVGHGFQHLKTNDPEILKRFLGTREIKPGRWWMMGDKDSSFDSRYWGTLPEANIYGRAYVLF